MDYENMTLKDFIEFAEIYPYTQDRYLMEKMFMEMNLIQLHLESYQFLLESNDISLSQIDVLMVESGINDQSMDTEQMFIEKGNSIANGIKKMFHMVGKAIASLFRGTDKTFTSKNKQIAELEAKNARQAQALEDVAMLANAAGARQKAEEVAEVANDAASAMKQQIERIIEHFNNNIGGGGAKILPIAGVDHESAIRVILEFANKQSGSLMSASQMNIYDTLCQKEYEVEGLSMIANIENIIDDISDIIDLKEDTASGVAYNSAKKMQMMGPKYIDRINRICNDIEASTKKNSKFKLSEESIKKKVAAADKLNKIFSELADFTDVGEVVMGNPVNNFLNRIGKDTAEQARKASEAGNNAAMRAKQDPDMKFKPQMKNVNGAREIVTHSIKKADFLKNYPAYLNVLNKLAVKLQSAAAEMSKALTAHINFRNAVIKAHAELTNSVDKVISSSKSDKPKDDEDSKKDNKDDKKDE